MKRSDFLDYFRDDIQAIDETLKQVLPRLESYPQNLHEAMHYAVFSGGKRFRPILVRAACRALGGDLEKALIPAASLEMIHCYSLVQDDLPSLDNDEMRRGKPTCHKKFGESTAILASDGLLTLALQILGQVTPAEVAVKLLEQISTGAGTCGMIGGQVADLLEEDQDLDLQKLDYINAHKTGKLITASVLSGAIVAEATESDLAKMEEYGRIIGLAFQAVDDLLDEDGYCKILGVDQVEKMVLELIEKAKDQTSDWGEQAKDLNFMADYLLHRMPKRTNL